ncbi:MAG TPA: hypothetical protein VJR22_06375 [Candidatus Nitrosotalea sp.]|nr:hypothetical protein [Nitrososphaerota archaeon]HKU33453.1 hypothetical protein [Candidatus Nitrosotalea sp.]
MNEVTKEGNLWLHAAKLEDNNNYHEACINYLKDASECMKHNSFVKAALSCSCAANCLANLGNLTDARQLYLETARIYEENAEMIIKESIRESLWSLQEAYEHYLLGGNNEKAQRIYDKYVFFARKINPFSGIDEVMKDVKMKKRHADTIMNISHANHQISSQVEETIQDFLYLRKSTPVKRKETVH